MRVRPCAYKYNSIMLLLLLLYTLQPIFAENVGRIQDTKAEDASRCVKIECLCKCNVVIGHSISDGRPYIQNNQKIYGSKCGNCFGLVRFTSKTHAMNSIELRPTNVYLENSFSIYYLEIVFSWRNSWSIDIPSSKEIISNTHISLNRILSYFLYMDLLCYRSQRRN